MCSLAELMQVRDWEKRPVQALLRDFAVREPRHALPRMTSSKSQCRSSLRLLVKANSKTHDIVIYADDSVSGDRFGSSRVEGLYTKSVEPTESQPPT